ncbi:MAG: MBL fold metallo-hydrolase, partial [bacterium]|nr:MBL fold metallo-hydrolase [bacterium]
MFNRKLKYGILLSLLTLCFVLFGVISYARDRQDLEIIFLDVGQGDAILISEGNYQMLIDGGRNGKLLINKLGRYIPFWDRNIEAILATHPDADHIGGLINAFESYKVGATIETGFPSDSLTYKELENKIVEEKSETIKAKQGIEIKFPESGAVVRILYPFSGDDNFNKNQSNESSIVAKVEVGESSFLLTGDLPKNKELELINSGLAL